MNVLLSYINTQLFIFTLKLVRYQPNRTIIGKFIVAKTAVSLAITSVDEGISNASQVEVLDKMTFTSNLGSRVKIKVDGDTDCSEYYSGFMIYFPVTVNYNTPTYYNYSYDYSDYGNREEYCFSGAISFDILIDGILIQKLSKPLFSHHNKVYETDKYKITITVVNK